MIMLENSVVWTFFFTLLNWDTKDFTHFFVSSVHLKTVQFAFALQIYSQVHEMGFYLHWAFALGAVNRLPAFWFTIHSQFASFLALGCSAQRPIPVAIKENNWSMQHFNSFHCLFLHCFELWLGVAPSSCFFGIIFWVANFLTSLLGRCVWWLFVKAGGWTGITPWSSSPKSEGSVKNHNPLFHCCWENSASGLGFTASQLLDSTYGS